MVLKTSWLIFIDRLFAPIYLGLKFLLSFGSNKKRQDTNKIIIVKFFGMGSIVRLAYVLKNSTINLNDITLVTLSKNKSIVNELKIHAIYISPNILGVLFGVPSTIFKVWLLKNARIVDAERSSNLAGIFRLFLALGKPSSSFAMDKMLNEKGNNQEVSLMNERATDALYKILQIQRAKNQLREHYPTEKRILVNVNAGDYLPQRKYPLKPFAAVLKYLFDSDNELQFVLTGGSGEVGYVGKFGALLNELNVPYENKAGKSSIKELIEDIKHCELIITNDSGPLHLANYYSVPCVVLWGPTSDKLVGYPNSRIMKNLSHEIHCSPCFKHPKSIIAENCKGQITCFKELSPEFIFQEIVSFKSNLEIAAGVQ